MKLKLIYPLAFALAMTLASTGCKHQPVRVTPIPNENAGMVGNQQDLNTLPFNSGNNPNVHSTGGGDTTDINSFDNMDQDRAALAGDTIHFGFDSAVIRDSEQANLQAVASRLTQDPSTKLLIEGYCDERGTEEYNRSLGERRALAAREALANLNIDPSRVRTISYGKDRPVDPGHNEAAWAKNRRDEFVLLHPKSGM